MKVEFMAYDNLNQENLGIFATREEAEAVAQANAELPQVLIVRSDEDARREIEAYEAAGKEWAERAIARARDAFCKTAESLGWKVREDGDDLIAEHNGLRVVFRNNLSRWFSLKFFRREGILYTEDEEDQTAAGLAAHGSVEWVRAISTDEPFARFDWAVHDAVFAEPKPRAPEFVFRPR